MMRSVLRRLAILMLSLAVALPGVAFAVERTGGPGNDRLVGTGGQDRLTGRGGNDTLIGRGGRDLLAGDRGNDVLRGGGGVDVLLGGGGRDRIDSRDRAADQVSCGNGQDVVYADAKDAVAGDCESVQR